MLTLNVVISQRPFAFVIYHLLWAQTNFPGFNFLWVVLFSDLHLYVQNFLRINTFCNEVVPRGQQLDVWVHPIFVEPDLVKIDLTKDHRFNLRGMFKH